MPTITPTRLPGLRAAAARIARTLAHAAQQLPAWVGVMTTLSVAAASFVAMGPAPLLA